MIRKVFLWAGAGILLLLCLIVFGTIVESKLEMSDAKAYPPPGQLVDVGGYRLHIQCVGTGSPVVVIEAGLGDWSTMWGFVQTEVAKTTRVCTYDRAGLGWSELGPLPRDANTFATELHALLKNAGIPGPYILAGHSLGGLPVRVFAHEYSSEVAGVVLMDSMVPQQFTKSSAGTHTSSGSQSRSSSMLTSVARFGLLRLLAKPIGMIPSTMSDNRAYYSRFVIPQNVQTYIDELRGMSTSGAQATAVTTIGSVPLIVLTARQNDLPNWLEWQAQLLQLSSNSKQVFSESGHNIHIENPEAAISALVQMVNQTRTK